MTPRARRATWAVAVLLASFLVGTFTLIHKNDDFPTGQAGPRVDISVSSGATGSAIASLLAKAGVVKSATRFVAEELKNPKSQGISPGIHSIESHVPSSLALSEMLDPKFVRGLIRVGEASTVQDVLSALKSAPTISFNYTPQATFKLPAFVPTKSLEGILAPADYAFANGTTATKALQSMIEKFSQNVGSDGLLAGFERYNAYQVLTVASMIQIEGDPVDYPKVAAVIYNRLRIGMALQLNSTVQYAAHLRGKIALSSSATQIASPYNTYRNVGLPPTPISNPSLAAISAALHPASGDWLYFITVQPHDTRFTNSYPEFEAWVSLYNKNLRTGAFK